MILKIVSFISLVGLRVFSCNAQQISGSIMNGPGGVPTLQVGAGHSFGTPQKNLGVQVFAGAPMGSGSVNTGGAVTFKR